MIPRKILKYWNLLKSSQIGKKFKYLISKDNVKSETSKLLAFFSLKIIILNQVERRYLAFLQATG